MTGLNKVSITEKIAAGLARSARSALSDPGFKSDLDGMCEVLDDEQVVGLYTVWSKIRDRMQARTCKDRESKLQGAEVLYGFMAWLTAREAVTVISSRSDTCMGIGLIERFLEANGLSGELRPTAASMVVHPDPLESDAVSDEEA